MAQSKNKPGSRPKPTDSPKGPAPVGVTSGVRINETWIRVFEKNEQVDESERLTDKQITEFMKSEFPGMRAMILDQIGVARSKYNRGGFHKKDENGRVVRPKIHSNPQGLPGGSGASTKHFGGATGPAKRDSALRHRKDFKAHKK